MLKNYFRVAFRNLMRNKAFSLINIFGLAIGLATCLLIMLYILDEKSYDRHYKDADRVYRIASPPQNQLEGWAAGPAPLAWGLKADFPEVGQSTRLLKVPDMDKMLLKSEDHGIKKEFFEPNGYYVDSTFFQVMSYEFKYGDPIHSLDRPNSVVLSDELATKLFGNSDPVGKTIRIGLPFGEYSYMIQGVLKNTGAKSHIPAHLFLSMRNGDIGGWVENMSNWAGNNIFHTYVKLREGTNSADFEKKLKPFIDRRGGADMKAMGISKTFFAQPLKDIYLHSNLGNEIAPNGSIQYLYILSSIAVFILLIACINFMNLSTAQSGERAREVGVRKVMGAQKGALIRQFLGESFLLCMVSLAVALTLVWLILPFFNHLTGKDIRLSGEPQLIGWIMGLTFITGLLSGLYPAFYLSAFRPVAVLKGRISNHFSANLIRKGLVIFQFSVSICLVIGAIVIFRQLNYLRNTQLGFNKEQQIVMTLRSNSAAKNYKVLRDELLKDPHVSSVTSGSSYPGISNVNDMLFWAEGKTKKDLIDIGFTNVENDYIETLGMKILYGRSFTKEYTADSNSIILNEEALRKLGYKAETAVGKKIYFDWENKRYPVTIVGVLKDFHFEGLQKKITPFGLVTDLLGNKHVYVIASLKTTDYATALSGIAKTWNAINPGTPFEYSFLDQDFQKNYEKEQHTSQLVAYFTVVAILIACLGLFGLSAFSAEQRTKEIGVRKVLGASVMNLTALLSRDFIRLVLIALVISTPIAWFTMDKWLQSFAYQIDIRWWMFAVAGTMAVLIALLTVSFQAVKAALTNPINSLRSE